MEKNNVPSARRSMPTQTVNDEVVTKEVEELFGQSSAPAMKPGADDFISQTQRSKVAIIIPLFGYWQDMPDGFLDEEVLDASIERARSYAHNYYVILIAEPKRLPISAAKVINSKYIAGNARGVAVPNGSSYGDYFRKGMDVARNETDAQYFVFLNPWVVIQDHGIDTIIDRVNLPDNAPVICGYDISEKVEPNDFLKYKATAPDELRMLTFNFFAVSRFIADMCPIDPDMKTQAYLERDFFQNVAAKGYNAVSSERVPIFTFKFDWRRYIPKLDYDYDQGQFHKKWKFVPEDIKYE